MQIPLAALRAQLLAVPAIASAVGQRVFKVAIPQNAEMPSIVLVPVSGTKRNDFDLAGAHSYRISVEARSRMVDGPTGADDLGALVLDALHGFSGVVDGVAIDRIIFHSEVSLYEDAASAFRRILDFQVHLE